MEKQTGNKTRLIIKTLLTGARLKPVEISEMLSEALGEKVSASSVRSVLSRISDSTRCDLGFFIRRNKQGNAFVYNMVEESLKFTSDQAYDLTLKRKAKHRYTLEKALKEFPDLCGYVKPEQPEIKPYPVIKTVRVDDNGKKPARLISFKSFHDTISPGRNIEITLRYSDKFSVSISSALKTLIVFCFAFALILAMVCLVAYLFFYSIFITVVIVALCFLVTGLLWKVRRGRGQ